MFLLSHSEIYSIKAVYTVGACALSTWHNAVLKTHLDKVFYYSMTHSSASPSQGSHVSPALDRLRAPLLEVWLTGSD